MNALKRLTRRELDSLLDAVRTGRLAQPVSEFALQRLLGRPLEPTLAVELNELLHDGPAAALKLLASSAGDPPATELVWSGPDETSTLRSTAVVVEELFRAAQQRVLVAGFAITAGADVFKVLAQRLDQTPALRVQLVLNVHERRGLDPNTTISVFAKEFWKRTWPGAARPSVFYDPRSMNPSRARAVMHAKCVVVDGTTALITSANFTPHAQHRNIELGVIERQPSLAAQIERQFDALIEAQHLVRLPG